MTSRPRLMAVLAAGVVMRPGRRGRLGVLPGSRPKRPGGGPIAGNAADRHCATAAHGTHSWPGRITVTAISSSRRSRLKAASSYGSGPEIVTTTGKVVWFHPLFAG